MSKANVVPRVLIETPTGSIFFDECAKIPPLRYRLAWRVVSGSLVVDISQARDLIRSEIDIWRAPLFKPLDAEFFKALEARDQDWQDRVAADKQKLRDLTIHPAIDAATTLEELDSIVFEELL
ncbi:hypothetical protein [Terasakiella sp.]|uniref:hypothetical protein n=1 Tax=Terasakiella sp. TaxID=2034861 RepID=UPI003AA9CC5E